MPGVPRALVGYVRVAPREKSDERPSLDRQRERLVEAAAQHREPHRIAFYLNSLAGSFHGLWTRGNERPELRFLQPDQPGLTRARLAMLEAVRVTLAAGLAILGVEPVEELR